MKTTLTRFWTSSWWVVLVLGLHAGAFTACSSGIGEHIATYRHLHAYAKENREHRDLSRERPSSPSIP